MHAGKIVGEEQFREAAIKAFCKVNSWDITPMKLLEVMYYDGCLEKKQNWGGVHQPSDVVYIHPKTSSMMTRYLAEVWYNKWSGFEWGYMTAIREQLAKGKDLCTTPN